MTPKRQITSSPDASAAVFTPSMVLKPPLEKPFRFRDYDRTVFALRFDTMRDIEVKGHTFEAPACSFIMKPPAEDGEEAKWDTAVRQSVVVESGIQKLVEGIMQLEYPLAIFEVEVVPNHSREGFTFAQVLDPEWEDVMSGFDAMYECGMAELETVELLKAAAERKAQDEELEGLDDGDGDYGRDG